jgi:hypothetical protein
MHEAGADALVLSWRAAALALSAHLCGVLLISLCVRLRHTHFGVAIDVSIPCC